MEKVILLRFGEIFLKGDNRGFFENMLFTNIQKAIKGFDCKLKKIAGRYAVQDYKLEDEDELVVKLGKVFGLYSLSVAEKIKTDVEEIPKLCAKQEINGKTFKVEVRRADKRFPIKSTEFAAICGEQILLNNPKLIVDVHNPCVVVNVDIREDGWTYVSSSTILCAGGMPVGTSGKGILLLSGGIDSPVAGYFMGKRGMNVEGLHFHSFPYTSEQAKDKVMRLAKQMKNYLPNMKLHVLSFTKVQEEINRNCDRDFMVILMRRIMMRVAQKLCEKTKAKAIITGESLGQVASQTIESITATNAVVSLPVFRPLIGFDKLDTIDVAKKIGTYEISIEPYEDCCTVFLPKRPVTKPKLEDVLIQESKLDINKLVNECLESEEIIEV